MSWTVCAKAGVTAHAAMKSPTRIGFIQTILILVSGATSIHGSRTLAYRRWPFRCLCRHTGYVAAIAG
jgi:hypothetical protein